jgi:phosphomannomutase
MAQAPLMMSVSGIRGIVGKSITPDLVLAVGRAFARFASKGTVIVGRDSRPSGEAISRSLTAALNMSGADVIDLGIVPTPTVQLMVEKLGAAGGIIVSASHNPIEWNAFKLVNGDGLFFTPKQADRFFSMMKEEGAYASWDGMGWTVEDSDAGEKHIDAVLEMVNVSAIKKKKYKVVLDSVNGAGSKITQTLLEKLGCRVVPINCDENGIFTRGAEPLPEHLGDLREAVVKEKADIGFAQDPDADRLAIVDNSGEPLGEEYTVTLVSDHILSTTSGPVVVNLSTTKAVEDIAEKHNVPFARSQVGEINVVNLMKKKKAVIGGEGNGGVIHPGIHLGRDSLVGIAFILDMMASRKKSIGELKGEMPLYFMKKGKIELKGRASVEEIAASVVKEWHSEKIDTRDGIRIDFTDSSPYKASWIHLRPSNTEPVYRIICEAPTEKGCRSLYKRFHSDIKKMMS